MDELPQTPVGQRLGELIQDLSAPEGVAPDVVSKLFHQNFIKAVGSPEALTEVLNSSSNLFPPRQTKVDAGQSGPFVLSVELTPPQGPPVLLTCTVEESDDHLITGLSTRPKPLEIDSLDQVEDLLAHHGVAGLSVAVIVDREIAWVRAWGLADRPANAPVSPEAILQCGSISKPVAAFAALALVDQGLLHLDADINEVLTSWKVPPVNGWQPVITIRDLLSHTAGLSVWGFPGYEVDSEIPSLVEVLDGMGNSPPIRSEALPGLIWRYSGGGTCVLQQALTDVSGERFPDLLRELVLDPLGMHDSTFEQPIPKRLEDRAASGHEGGNPVKGRWHVYPEMAAAGLWTTASDLARFAIGVAAAHAGRSGALISKRVATEALSPHRVAPMGLGLFLSGSPSAPTFGHGGANAGFTGRMLSAFDGSLGLVGLSNSIEGPGAINDLFQYLARDYGQPELLTATSLSQDAQQAMLRAKPIEHREPAEVPRDRIEALFGKYETDHGTHVAVGSADGLLSMEVEARNKLLLYPLSPLEWVSRSVDVRVEFENGRLTLHQLGQTVAAKRIT